MTIRKPNHIKRQRLTEELASRPEGWIDRLLTFPGAAKSAQRRSTPKPQRRTQMQSLESRQLLAGPQLEGVQPNVGELLSPDGTTVLNVSPQELTLRFSDDARSSIDENTLGAIQITRAGDDGVFEAASAVTDLNSTALVNETALLEFRSAVPGTAGNGIQVVFQTRSDTLSASPLVNVEGRTVTLTLNSNGLRPTRVSDLIQAVNADTAASALIDVNQITGSAQARVGLSVIPGTSITLDGANAS
ncbi:MAG: hypothetical protein AAFN70_14275, partial [Planctomycetota bacterium]